VEEPAVSYMGQLLVHCTESRGRRRRVVLHLGGWPGDLAIVLLTERYTRSRTCKDSAMESMDLRVPLQKQNFQAVQGLLAPEDHSDLFNDAGSKSGCSARNNMRINY
jgi:hypothetical protein